MNKFMHNRTSPGNKLTNKLFQFFKYLISQRKQSRAKVVHELMVFIAILMIKCVINLWIASMAKQMNCLALQASFTMIPKVIVLGQQIAWEKTALIPNEVRKIQLWLINESIRSKFLIINPRPLLLPGRIRFIHFISSVLLEWIS